MATKQFRKAALIIIWITFPAIVVFTAWFIKIHLSQPSFHNAMMYPKDNRELPEFQLMDANMQQFGKNALLGKWSFIFFGYTYCPDICPITMQTLNSVSQAMDPKSLADTQFIFISIDPVRDNNTHLNDYVSFFNKDFIAASGKQEQLTFLSKAFDTTYTKVEADDSSTSYLMAHSPSIFLTNPQAQRVAVLPPPHKTEKIVADFYRIQALQ